MDINEIKTKYLPVRTLDKDEKGTIEIVEYEGRNFVLRTMNGNIGSYTALKNITSPYLPKIEFAEYANGKTIVIEEYIEGEKNISSLTDEKAIVSSFCELCDVLSVLHGRGIIHRDIKPSNILIAPDGHIRLIDFDASRYYDDSKDSDTRYLGTKGYAPPEQFGYSQTNATADIYSLGVTLKNVLGEKAEKRKYRHIIRKCTEFDPKNRYPSASAVKKALRAGNRSVQLPALIGLAAAAAFILHFTLIPSEPENIIITETSEASSADTVETTSVTSGTTAASSKTATTVPETEETTTVPETVASLETEETTVTAETSETPTETTTSETTSVSSVTSDSTAKPQTSTTAGTTATTVTTTEETKASETTSQSLRSAPAGTIYMTCTTDKLRTPASSVVKISGRNFDELSEPWVFDPDEAVIGTWKYLTSTGQGTAIYDKMYYKKIVSDAKNATYPKSLRFDDDGTCRFITVYPSSGTIYSDSLDWTYGLIAAPAVNEYYFYEHYYIYSAEDGKEYLFLERKNGDYMNADDPSAGLHYLIYERDTEE